MSYKFVGYFENWAQWREQRRNGWGFKPNQIDPSLYTHINYAFVAFGFISPGIDPNNPRLTGDYKVCAYEWNDETELFLLLQALKQTNPNLKTLLSLGGWNFNLKTHKSEQGHPVGEMTYQLFSRMVERQEHRQEFIASAIDYAHKHGFDGVDIDWEYPGTGGTGDENRGGKPEDFPNFLALLQEFRSAAGNDFLLTMATSAIVPAGVPNESEYKSPQKYFAWVAECAKYLDWINVMTYDYRGAWDTQTGVLAPLLEDSIPGGPYSVRATIDNYLVAFQSAGIPSTKIVMGVPTYGRTFKVPDMQSYSDKEPGKPVPGETITERQGQPGPVTAEAGFLSYPEVLERYPNNESRGWHEPTLTPFAFNDSEWVSYEDEASVAYKASYLIEQNLGGVMIWGIAEDDIKAGFPLQRKIKGILDDPTSRPALPQVPLSNKLPEDVRKVIATIERMSDKVKDFASKIERGEETTLILHAFFDDDIASTLERSFQQIALYFGNTGHRITEVWEPIKGKFAEIVETAKNYQREDSEDDSRLSWLEISTKELIEELKAKIDEEVEFENITDEVRESLGALLQFVFSTIRPISLIMDLVIGISEELQKVVRMRWELAPMYQMLALLHMSIKMEQFESNKERTDQEDCELSSDSIRDTSQNYFNELMLFQEKWRDFVNKSYSGVKRETIKTPPNSPEPGIFPRFYYTRFLQEVIGKMSLDGNDDDAERTIKQLRDADIAILTAAVLGSTDEVFS